MKNRSVERKFPVVKMNKVSRALCSGCIYMCPCWNMIQQKNWSARDQIDASLKTLFASLTMLCTNVALTALNLVERI
jgi:hypothetical protein